MDSKIKKTLNKFITALPTVLLLNVSYCLLGPLEIYRGNSQEFNFLIYDFLWFFIGITIISCIIIPFIIAILPDKISKIINALLLGIGVASYIQNMFMNIKLSEIDGSPMQWNELNTFSIFNLFIWIFLILSVFSFCMLPKLQGRKIVTAIPVFLSTIQLAAILSLIFTPTTTNKSNYYLSGENQFRLATDNNIIVFILDTFGNTQLDVALQKYPDALDELNDFTYYNNADCHYYCTFPSLTHMFTGNDFDFNMYSQDWMNESWESRKAIDFWNTLHQLNYNCYLFSSDIGYTYGDILNLDGKFDNVTSDEKIINSNLLITLLGKMSIYKYAPYNLKPYFEVLTSEFYDVISYKDNIGVSTKNVEYYTLLTDSKLSITPGITNALMIQHLSGTHLPYITDMNAKYVEESTVEDTIKGLTVIINEYINQLKSLGLYENATIIITADHGSWNDFDPQPIFFIKKANETHVDLQINSAPISLDDFQATILNILGLDYSEYGTSIYDWKENEYRERSVYMRQEDNAFPSVQGSPFNVYYKYTYFKDKEELNTLILNDVKETIPATPWR